MQYYSKRDFRLHELPHYCRTANGIRFIVLKCQYRWYSAYECEFDGRSFDEKREGAHGICICMDAMGGVDGLLQCE